MLRQRDKALIFLCIFSFVSCCYSRKYLIGALFGDEESMETGQRAVEMAIQRINRNKKRFEGVQLEYIANGTSGVIDTFKDMRNACYQLSQGIYAFIGPISSSSVKAVYPIADRLHIPIIAPFATDPTLSLDNKTFPYLIKMSASDSVQGKVLAALVDHFQWTRLAIVTSLSDYGINGIQEFQKIALVKQWSIATIEQFLPTANAANIRVHEQLLRIRDDKMARIIILNCLAPYAKYVLLEAERLGMTGQGWAWVVTDGVTAMDGLYDSDKSVPSHLQGLLGTRPAISNDSITQDFIKRWKKASKYPRSIKGPESIEGLVYRTYDSVFTLAYALADCKDEGVDLIPPMFPKKICSTSEAEPWADGEELLNKIRKSSGEGVMNYLNFTTMNTPWSTDFDIVLLEKKGFKKVGLWSNDELTIDESQIVFMGNTTKVPVDVSLDLSNVTLKVTTIVERPFVMYEDGVFSGFCIDLLTRLQERMNFTYEIELVPDATYGAFENGKWIGMVGELVYGRADIAVAPFTISYERQQVIDFTKPYLDLGLTFLMKIEYPEVELFAFLLPFDSLLWTTVIAATLMVGIIISICSYLSPHGYYGAYLTRSDPDDMSDYDNRNALNMYQSLWFSYASLVQQGADSQSRSPPGRVVAGCWWIAVTIIISTYTANLAAFFTVSRMDTGIGSIDDLAEQSEIKYGTIRNSQPQSYFQSAKLELFQDMADFMRQHNTFAENSNDGIARVRKGNYSFIWDSSVLDYVANQEPCDVMTVGGLFGKLGYGLGLPKSSRFKVRFEREILRLRQEGFIDELTEKYFGGVCPSRSTSGTSSSKMNFVMMAGVFYVMYIGFVIAVFALILECVCASYKDSKASLRSRDRMQYISTYEALQIRFSRTVQQMFSRCSPHHHSDTVM
ncbi:glutamate receptor 2-like [Anneissia japonica]|uniref:glutamate receptor 2-like n=1 Tax=Anneissia japonica TaxID=1529436 RepID=UPI0014255929|nr:glutamate receptor 2-like [Anneissia japonica]XP_033097832.1 glutamate receptor 2-like [Anneissia japonica]